MGLSHSFGASAPHLVPFHDFRTAHLFQRLRRCRPETSDPAQRFPTSPVAPAVLVGRVALSGFWISNYGGRLQKLGAEGRFEIAAASSF